jgi:DNA-binding LacI/PurR family transcriptional regulator
MTGPVKRVTRRDVAEKAGVTPTIVSYVVNDNRYVDKDKRERVKLAMKQLGYRPNSIARALKGKHSHLILFLVDNLLSEHFGQINKQMNAWATEHDYFICLCETQNTDDFVKSITQSYFDGLIIGSSTFRTNYIQDIIDTNIPLVLLEMKAYTELTGTFGLINSGLYQGARDCCKALLDKGRKHLVYVDSFSDTKGKDISTDFRYGGFVDELKAHGKFDDGHCRILSGCSCEADLNQEIEKLLDSGFQIDGIFGRTDAVALNAMYRMINLGHRVPEDCSVIGVNNSRLGYYSSPKLTTLNIDRAGIGKSATSILSRMFNGEEISKKALHVSLKTNIITRESL